MKICSVKTLFTNVTFAYMSHIIGVINCSLQNKAYCKTHCCSWCKACPQSVGKIFLTCIVQIV